MTDEEMKNCFWTHKKRRTIYRVLDFGVMQAENNPLDNQIMVIYKDEENRLWIRPKDEFLDGRFEHGDSFSEDNAHR